MTVFTCRDTFGAMMTCVYEAWASRLGHGNLRLQLEPVFQEELFCTYVHVEENEKKAEKVIRAVRRKISFQAYRQIFLAALSCEPDKLDAIYRYLVLGFAVGAKVTDMLSRPEVAWIMELARRVDNEACRYREFTRFTLIGGRIYVAHIEPRCDVTALAAEYFTDRMPSEYWMIIDDHRRTAAVHPKNLPFYMTRLSEREILLLKETEKQRDTYTDLWKEFFRSIGIEARENPRCQRNLLPLRYRSRMTEFL